MVELWDVKLKKLPREIWHDPQWLLNNEIRREKCDCPSFCEKCLSSPKIKIMESRLITKNDGQAFKRINEQKKLSMFGDKDRDGVPNILDCAPLNKHEQGTAHKIQNFLMGRGFREGYLTPVSRGEVVKTSVGQLQTYTDPEQLKRDIYRGERRELYSKVGSKIKTAGNTLKREGKPFIKEMRTGFGEFFRDVGGLTKKKKVFAMLGVKKKGQKSWL